MKKYLARLLRKQADKLDPPPKSQSWIFDPAYTTSTSSGKITYTVRP